jgi:hypothetical protein
MEIKTILFIIAIILLLFINIGSFVYTMLYKNKMNSEIKQIMDIVNIIDKTGLTTSQIQTLSKTILDSLPGFNVEGETIKINKIDIQNGTIHNATIDTTNIQKATITDATIQDSIIRKINDKTTVQNLDINENICLQGVCPRKEHFEVLTGQKYMNLQTLANSYLQDSHESCKVCNSKSNKTHATINTTAGDWEKFRIVNPQN